MRKTDNTGRERLERGLSLIEIIFAFMILSVATFSIYQVLAASQSHLTKMRFKSQLITLTQAKMEDILFNNTADATPWTPFPEDPDFEYMISIQEVKDENYFPEYKLTMVTINTRGPLQNPGSPQYNFYLSTFLLSDTQDVTTTGENRWGEGLSRGVRIK